MQGYADPQGQISGSQMGLGESTRHGRYSGRQVFIELVVLQKQGHHSHHDGGTVLCALVELEEQELPIDDAAVRSLLDNQLRRYFAEQIEGWDELEGLTEQQITEMVAAPNVPQRIRRQLEKNGFLMDSFWESVAKSLFDLVRQYKEKLV